MTIYDESWVKAEEAKRAWMAEHSLYKADDEHASCGVGLVVAIDGEPSRGVVEKGIQALQAVRTSGKPLVVADATRLQTLTAAQQATQQRREALWKSKCAMPGAVE